MEEYIVLTSKNRKLHLPLQLKDVGVDEDIVSTNAPHGMLFVVDKVLKSYFAITEEEIEQGSLVCVPLFDDYKEFEKRRLIEKLNSLEKI
jgi:hypothetical protein